MRISDLAMAARVGVETVRYYQRIGLLRVPELRGKTRTYETDDLRSLRFIRRAQALGFSLEEIRTLISLSSGECASVARTARERLAQVTSKIDSLRRIEKTLQDVIEHCETRKPYQGCPIIETLIQD